MNKTLFLRAALCAMLLAPIVPITPVGFAQGAPGAAMAPNARVIVKYKADAVLLRKRALSASDQHAVQAQTLGQRHGIALRSGAGLHERAQVVIANGMSSQQLANTLAQDAEVEYAVPDERKRATVVPNDTLYTTGGSAGPASGQWYLRPNLGEVQSSINAEPAWNVTAGSSSVVVAVLDTGVRFDHPDLKSVANGGNLLPGYDMIADATTANDGGGRDADASDPGDWISQADIDSGLYAPCTAADISDSSWHGTQTAGLIGALTDNGVGMASVGRTVRVLPVRVLGKCGGFDSDIIAGMLWAAGLDTGDPNVPLNPVANRAKIINMSLGGSGPCTLPYQDAVSALNLAGVTIVASAGNSAGQAVSSPANCTGVVAVAGLRHVGTKVGFSDLGTQIAISAPAGNCVNQLAGQPCLYPILTTSNAGLTTPAAAIYTDGNNNLSLGTSFSAPLVAGTAALLLSAQPALSPSQVLAALQSTARPFPSTGAASNVTQCHAPNGIDQLECYCTTTTCGAGMLDAGAALQSALASAGIVANITVLTSARAAGTPIDFSAATTAFSSPPPGNVTYAWIIVDGGGIVSAFTSSTNGPTASLTPNNVGGTIVVRLTVTDQLGHSSTTEQSVSVPAPAPPPPPAATSSGGGGAMSAVWLALLLGAVLALARRRA